MPWGRSPEGLPARPFALALAFSAFLPLAALSARQTLEFAIDEAAWGAVHMKPKHHYLWHNALRLSEGALAMDCFVHERKHQLAKQALFSVSRSVSGMLRPTPYRQGSSALGERLHIGFRLLRRLLGGRR